MNNATNYEVRYDDVKKNDTAKICIRFYNDYSDLYLPVFAEALTPTDTEIKKYGAIEPDQDPTGVSEFCRLNLTKWKIVDAHEEVLPLVKRIIGKTLWLYFNGAEVSWKFYDPDGTIDRANAMLDVIKNKISDKKYDALEEVYDANIGDCYAPHNDNDGNYGDEKVHAVYDMKCQ